VKRGLFVSLLLGLFLVPSAGAKDKQYQDGTVIVVERWRPGAMLALDAAVSGYNIKPTWIFRVQVGDWTYGGSVTKRFGKLDETEWPANAPVQIRFDINGGMVATRTKMYIKNAAGKEVESDILTITDKEGRNDYCGTRKCDPESAAKKYAKEHGNS
jgi:hypothetical protein